MSQTYAFFDLDHTLLPHDTQALFCNFVLQREGWRRIWLLWFLPCLPWAGAKILSLRTMKRLYLGYLVGMRRETLEAYVEEFVKTDFAAALHPELLEEIARHRSEGRVLVLNSASPEFYLHAIGKHLGFDYVIGTKVEMFSRQPWLPAIIGPNNKEEEKIIAMRKRGIIPESTESLPDSWAYSDSSADLPLLQLAEHPVMVHPSPRLAAVGQERGWPALRPSRPYRNRREGIIAACLQTLGLYRVPKMAQSENA